MKQWGRRKQQQHAIRIGKSYCSSNNLAQMITISVGQSLHQRDIFETDDDDDVPNDHHMYASSIIDNGKVSNPIDNSSAEEPSLLMRSLYV